MPMRHCIPIIVLNRNILVHILSLRIIISDEISITYMYIIRVYIYNLVMNLEKIL